MGNSQLETSVSRQKLQYSLENDLIFIKKINDDRYGEVKIMQIKDSKPRQLVALKTIMASSIRDCEEIFAQVSFRNTLDLPTITRVKAFDKAEMDQYCSHYFKIYVLYEYYEKSLKSEIEKREGKRFPKVHFAEIEIYHLIDCVLSALILFFKSNIVHSDIRPHTIFYSEEGIYKLNDIQFMSGLNAYTQFLMGAPDYDNCFLSPELFDQLGHRILQPQTKNPQKSDIFSLGMTAIEAATLRSISSCYDFDSFTIKESVLSEYLDEVKQKYSEDLYNLLKNMVRIDEKLRFDYTMVYQSLSPRQEQMREYHQESFNQEEVPPREDKPTKANNNLHIEESKVALPAVKERNHETTDTINRELWLELNALEERIKETMIRSEGTMQRFVGNDVQRMRDDLMNDEYFEFVAKREEVLRKSAQARESITMERKKKTVGMIDERDLLDSNKVYEMYLEEYENLKNKEYA